MDDGPRRSDWFLREWAVHMGKRQADLVRDLGWLKGRASKIWNGTIPYRRDIVVEVAAWLGVKEYELLMHPRDALAFRRLRETAQMIVAESDPEPFVPAPTQGLRAPKDLRQGLRRSDDETPSKHPFTRPTHTDTGLSPIDID
jgi:transcriptional regulator with XRE-family HTH domain